MGRLTALLLVVACGEGEEPPGAGGHGGADTASDDSGDATEAPGCAALTWRSEPEVRLDTQAAVDAFCGSWNAVDGDLVVDVGGTDDPITELDGLACLCEVKGDFTLTGGEATSSAAPPPPHVTGDIELTLLERIGGDLVLSHHPALGYVQSMVALREVGGDLVIAHNPQLELAAFYGLERVGGTVWVQDLDQLLILRLPVATSLGGLVAGAAGDAATLYYLVEVNLDSLATVEGDLTFTGARNLRQLSLPGLQSVGGGLRLEATCRTALSAPALGAVGSLRLDGNCALEDLDGLGTLTRVTGEDAQGSSVHLQGNDALAASAVDALAARLVETGTGSLDLANAGACADLLAAYGEGYCD